MILFDYFSYLSNFQSIVGNWWCQRSIWNSNSIFVTIFVVIIICCCCYYFYYINIFVVIFVVIFDIIFDVFPFRTHFCHCFVGSLDFLSLVLNLIWSFSLEEIVSINFKALPKVCHVLCISITFENNRSVVCSICGMVIRWDFETMVYFALLLIFVCSRKVWGTWLQRF